MTTAQETYQTAYEHLAHSDPDMWLGALVWYGVEDLRIRHKELVQALAASGLSGFIPRVPSDVDVFRRVCSSVARGYRRMPTRRSRVYENYLIRDIPMDDECVYKVLVRETVEPGKVKYETELCTIAFHRADGGLSFDCSKRDATKCRLGCTR